MESNRSPTPTHRDRGCWGRVTTNPSRVSPRHHDKEWEVTFIADIKVLRIEFICHCPAPCSFARTVCFVGAVFSVIRVEDG